MRVPAGVADGQRIRLQGKGTPGRNGGPSGDLFIVCRVTPPALFGRDGQNLTVKVPITFALPTPEALRVAYAESFSVKLRLALRARNDETTADPNSLIYTAPTQDQ